MIHHLSIPAWDTRHVVDVLAELFGGVVTGFGPYRRGRETRSPHARR